MAKLLSPENKTKLLSLNHKTITNKDIVNLFGFRLEEGSKFKKLPPLLNTTDKFTLKAGEYINTTDIETTVGSFLMNKLFLEGCVNHIIPNGYCNDVMDARNIGKLFDLIAAELLKGTVNVETQLYDFLNRYEFWSLNLVSVFSPSYSQTMITPNQKLAEYKDALLKQYPNPNIQTMVMIEEKLVAKAKELSEGDPGRNIFDSGARGSFDNDYKNMFISIGPVKDPATGEFHFMNSNYIDGLEKEDLVAAGNLVINAEYPKALGTAVSGYQTKQLQSILQNITIDEPGSDCGSKEGLTVTLTPKNINSFMYQYIMGKDGRLMLIDENMPKEFMNRPLKIRSPMFCTSEKLCSKCVGERFYKIGVTNIGLLLMNMTSSMLNANLKQRHSMKINVNKVDLSKLLI